jgi:dephospho-CoA kinase
MSKKIIALAGEIACGKGTVAKYLIEKHGAKSLRFSDCLRDVAKRMYLDPSRETYQTISTFFREKFGENTLSKVIFEDAKNSDADLLLLDGVRRPSDITYLKEMPGFKLVYIDIDPEIAFERIIKRCENTDEAGKTYEQFLKDREQEAESQIRGLKDIADFVVENNQGEKELIEGVDNILKQIEA